MKDLAVITFCVVAGFYAYVAAMSFVLWQNAFRVLGHGFIARMAIFLVVISMVIYFIPGGKA
ncbi:hypothetical protein ACFPZP_16255 [Citrobacter bitternis]|uniref:Uncharacterized protein n=1 Tax=Citrobacter bitternis TaxID=1585982 RepID=A0ABW1Q339_9ENTR|nr:hypothetical protein [Enterobacteriaceae bacterium]